MSILISPEIRWQIENRKMENNKYYFHLKIDGKLLLQVIYTVYDKDYTLRKKVFSVSWWDLKSLSSTNINKISPIFLAYVTNILWYIGLHTVYYKTALTKQRKSSCVVKYAKTSIIKFQRKFHGYFGVNPSVKKPIKRWYTQQTKTMCLYTGKTTGPPSFSEVVIEFGKTPSQVSQQWQWSV